MLRYSNAVAIVVAVVFGAAVHATPKAAVQQAAPTHKAPARKQAAKKATPTEILATQLILNRYRPGENLAEVCRQTSFRDLAIALGMNRDLITRSKGEFETSEQYAERTAKIANVLASDSFAICISPSDIDSFSYRADEQIFEGSIGETITVWRNEKKLKPYRSKTKMGIAATVKPFVVFEINAALSFPKKAFGCLSGEYTHSFQFPYGRSDAPLLKSIGKIVIVAKLEPPYVDLEDTPGNPTLDNPYDIYTRSTTVHIKPESLIVIDYAGEPAWSCRVGALAPLQRPTPQDKTANWTSIVDYPLYGFRDNMTGTVSAVLKIERDGKVSDCKITMSSGYPELDRATCAAWTKRAKFSPASDQNGNPIPSEFSISKTWTRYGN